MWHPHWTEHELNFRSWAIRFQGIFQKNNLWIEEYFIALNCPWCVHRTFQLSVWLCFKCESILRCNWWKKNVFIFFYNPKTYIKKVLGSQTNQNPIIFILGVHRLRYACLYPHLTRGPVPTFFFFFWEGGPMPILVDPNMKA